MGALETQFRETLWGAEPPLTRSDKDNGEATQFHSLVGVPLSPHVLQTDHIFRRRQYNTKIGEWRIGKNVKDNEMRAIIRKEQKRKMEDPPKESVFRVRKQHVNPHKIARFKRSKGVTDDDILVLDAGKF